MATPKRPVSPAFRPNTPHPLPAPEIDFASIAPLEPPAEFFEQASALGIEFEPGDVERLGKFLACMLAFNETTNLTSITEPAMAWRRHILDSLTLLAPLAEVPESGSLIDVGSGGGLPGIPLAVCCPKLAVTLLEATGKKADFLGKVTAVLALTNVRVVAERAEVAGHDRGEKKAAGREGGCREMFDVATARAVGRINVLAELVLPFVKEGGIALFIKGEKAVEELAEAVHAIAELGGSHVATIETPTGRIVVIDKVKRTPRIYPRADGEPKRTPINAPRSKR